MIFSNFPINIADVQHNQPLKHVERRGRPTPPRASESEKRVTLFTGKLFHLFPQKLLNSISSTGLTFKYMKAITISARVLLFSRIKTCSGPYLLCLKLFTNHEIPILCS